MYIAAVFYVQLTSISTLKNIKMAFFILNKILRKTEKFACIHETVK